MSVVRRQYQIYIERPVAVVFGFLIDLKNHARLALPAQPEEALTHGLKALRDIGDTELMGAGSASRIKQPEPGQMVRCVYGDGLR